MRFERKSIAKNLSDENKIYGANREDRREEGKQRYAMCIWIGIRGKKIFEYTKHNSFTLAHTSEETE